ncbi:MAG: hypothetical protein R3C42_08135 [Parvularculaceae bacterium]
MKLGFFAAIAAVALGACAQSENYDVIIRGGVVYDGTGAPELSPISQSTAIASPPSAILAARTPKRKSTQRARRSRPVSSTCCHGPLTIWSRTGAVSATSARA